MAAQRAQTNHDKPPLLLAIQGDSYEEFKSTAQKVEDVPFVQTTDAKVAKAAGLTKPGISAIKNFVGGCPSLCRP